jgi:hypothetical protein
MEKFEMMSLLGGVGTAAQHAGELDGELDGVSVEVEGLLVGLEEGLVSGELFAVGLVLAPNVHAAAKTITAASSAGARPLPLIFL